jgi:hypothetical protein
MIIKRIVILAFGILLGALPGRAQVLLNGSFENNIGACLYNINNSTFNGSVNSCFAYGIGNQLDIVRSSCGYGLAQDGEWFVAMAVDISNTQNDAFSMTLSSPVTMGNTYTLSWVDRGWSPYNTNVLQVGISTSANTFGTLLFSTPLPTIGTWTARNVTFNAPNNGQYITARVVVGSYGWTHVDHFVLGVPTPTTSLNLYGLSSPTGSDSLHWEDAEQAEAFHYQMEFQNQNGDFEPIGIPHLGTSTELAQTVHLPQLYPHFYRVQRISMDGESSYSSVLALHGLAVDVGWSVFPNPSMGQFRVELEGADPSLPLGQLELFNSAGQSVWKKDARMQVIVDAAALSKGMYLLRWTGQGKAQAKRVVLH